MRTETKVKIITETGEVVLGYWDVNQELWIEVKNTDDIMTMAKELNCSPALVETMKALVDIFTEAVCDDLRDIWKRLDRIERRVNAIKTATSEERA